MPVLFEAPQPFDQSVAENYGRRQSLMQQAGLFRQQQGQVAGLQEAELSARVSGASAAADASYRGSALESEGVGRAQEIASRYGLQDQEIRARAELAGAQMQHQAQMRVLDEQLAEQQLSFREQQDLRQLQAGWKSVDEDPNLTDQEKYQIKSLMGPRISRLMAQESLSRQKAQEEEIKLIQGRNALLQQQAADAEAFQAAQAKNAFGWEMDLSAAPQIAEELLSKNPALAMDAEAFEKAMQEESRKRGKGVRWYQTKSGRQIHPEDKARIEGEIKMREQRAAREEKIRSEMGKTYSDTFSNLMKPDANGQSMDVEKANEIAMKAADGARRAMMTPQEREEEDQRTKAMTQAKEEGQSMLMEFEKKRGAIISNGKATPQNVQDLTEMISILNQWKSPYFAPKEEKAKFVAAYKRILSDTRLGMGELPAVKKPSSDPWAGHPRDTSNVPQPRQLTPQDREQVKIGVQLIRQGYPMETVERYQFSPAALEEIRRQSGK